MCWHLYIYLEKVTKQEDFYENLKWLLHLYLLENCHKYTIILGFRDSSKAHDTQFFFSVLHLEADEWSNESVKQWPSYSQSQYMDWVCVRKIELNNTKQMPLYTWLQ